MVSATGAASAQTSQSDGAHRRAALAGERVGRPFEGEGHRDGGELGGEQQHHRQRDAQLAGRGGRPARYRATTPRMMENSEPSPSAETSRFNASVDRRWESVIDKPGLTGRPGSPSNSSYRGFPDCNHPRREQSAMAAPAAATVMPSASRLGSIGMRSGFLILRMFYSENRFPLPEHAPRPRLDGPLAEATSWAHEHDQIGLRLLRLGPRQQPGVHGRGARRSAGSWPRTASAWSMAAARSA